MARFSIKETIEQNVTIWLRGTLLTGFLSGIGVYRAVQDMAGLKMVSAADRENSKRQLAELEQKLVASEQRVATATAQTRRAYYAIENARLDVNHDGSEWSLRIAAEIKERLSDLGARVRVRKGEPARLGCGVVWYTSDSAKETTLQVQALISDILATNIINAGAGFLSTGVDAAITICPEK